MSRFRTTPIFPSLEPLSLPEKIALFFCLYVSLCLIARLWLRHRKDHVQKKLLWSMVLLIPVFGWVFFGAFYTPLGSNGGSDTPNSSE
jgi:hypothetical protein